jgi:hypothetical protein
VAFDLTNIGNIKGLLDRVKNYRTKGVAIENRNGHYHTARIVGVWDPKRQQPNFAPKLPHTLSLS